MSAKSVETVVESGTEVFIPLNKLKKSPKNARKTPHSEAAIEAYAASIAAKGILQNLVVEPELDGDGSATGFYFVTIGEGRRLAQLLRVKRKEIKKTEPIRCIVDTANDPHEISLDENVTRENMHPADQFEAFRSDWLLGIGDRWFIRPPGVPACKQEQSRTQAHAHIRARTRG
jgi:ParB family transcriptional regulator, chromosome partitioning protein